MGQIVTSFTTYTGKQSEFRELITQKFSQYPALAALGFNVVNDIQSVKKYTAPPFGNLIDSSDLLASKGMALVNWSKNTRARL